METKWKNALCFSGKRNQRRLLTEKKWETIVDGKEAGKDLTERRKWERLLMEKKWKKITDGKEVGKRPVGKEVVAGKEVVKGC